MPDLGSGLLMTRLLASAVIYARLACTYFGACTADAARAGSAASRACAIDSTSAQSCKQGD